GATSLGAPGGPSRHPRRPPVTQHDPQCRGRLFQRAREPAGGEGGSVLRRPTTDACRPDPQRNHGRPSVQAGRRRRSDPCLEPQSQLRTTHGVPDTAKRSVAGSGQLLRNRTMKRRDLILAMFLQVAMVFGCNVAPIPCLLADAQGGPAGATLQGTPYLVVFYLRPGSETGCSDDPAAFTGH